MMKTPRVTVIIPTYDRAAFLSEAVDSVLRQTFDDFEIIISDDRSSDNTREIASPLLSPQQRQAEHLFDALLVTCFIYPSTVMARCHFWQAFHWNPPRRWALLELLKTWAAR